jgi:hypothetical protein
VTRSNPLLFTAIQTAIPRKNFTTEANYFLTEDENFQNESIKTAFSKWIERLCILEYGKDSIKNALSSDIIFPTRRNFG